ncbi:hypothetical protein [Vibrio litoralis]|uniref:hypothetical protein n=1 Tax=Vibrio litoralis TaxID=335972 RepID=UPI000483EBC5|nr:hypothetical protein [Vibrio litoralis]
MKLLLALFGFSISTLCLASAGATPQLDDNSYSVEFKRNFLEVKKLGPNFNHEDYIFSYPCGGGAICSSIYSSEGSLFIDFPDNYIGASESHPFHIKFELDSDVFCVWGKSAYDLTIYNNSCYQLKGVKLGEIVGE